MQSKKVMIAGLGAVTAVLGLLWAESMYELKHLSISC